VNKAHKVNIAELPNRASGGIRVEYSCPSGCLIGYSWSRNPGTDAEVRACVEALAKEHWERMNAEPAEVPA
jgi:hypothetical protein